MSGFNCCCAGFENESEEEPILSPKYHIRQIDDFFIPTVSFVSTATIISTLQWQVAAVGTATTSTFSANSGSQIGVVTVGTGTDTTGRVLVETYGAGANAGLSLQIALASSLEWEWKVATPTASDGTNTFVTRVGWGNTVTGVAPTEGVWFEWDANTNTHIICKTATGGVPHVAATTSVVAGTGYHLLRIKKEMGSPIVTFYIDGVQVAQDTCPTAAIAGPFAQIVKSAGTTTRTLSMDWFWIDYVSGTAR